MSGTKYPADMYVVAALAVVVGVIHSFVATPFLPGLDIPLIVLPLLFVLVRKRPMYIVFACFMGVRAYFACVQIRFPGFPGGEDALAPLCCIRGHVVLSLVTLQNIQTADSRGEPN